MLTFCALKLTTRYEMLSPVSCVLQQTDKTTSEQEYITYGFDEGNTWRAIDVNTNNRGGIDFVATWNGKRVCELSLSSPGRHNVLNALAVFVSTLVVWKSRRLTNHVTLLHSTAKNEAVIKDIEVIGTICTAIQAHRGVLRRLQYVGPTGSCEVYDDYAHHPTAIHAVVRALRQRFRQARLVVIFQPHTFSRTAALLREFSEVLSLADRVIISSVYGIRAESELAGVRQTCGEELSELIGRKSVFVHRFRDVLQQVLLEVRLRHTVHSQEVHLGNVPSTDVASNERHRCRTVLVTMGAGDSNELSRVLHHFLGSQAWL